MTEKAFKTLIRAMAILCVVVGGFGSVLCVPYAISTNLVFITVAGIYFVAGGIMIVGGLNALTLIKYCEKK